VDIEHGLQRNGQTAGEIGGELAASYLVESTVRKEKEHPRITAKLVRVKDQVQVWNNTYDLQLSGLLSVQQEIGNAIASGRRRILAASQNGGTSFDPGRGR
jgi:TolB-like protein